MNRIFFSYSLILLLILSPLTNFAQTAEDAGIDGYESLNDALQHPNEATKVWISGSVAQIKQLTDKCGSLQNLSAFKIKDSNPGTDWTQLFNALSRLSDIKEIELTFNDISTIPASISNFKDLENLTVWGSPNLNYAGLFESLSGLKKLKSLELNSNGLKTVPSEIKTLQHLERFVITDNETVDYSDLIEKLSYLTDLKDLSLEVNAIAQLPPSIIKLKNLKNLNISNNYISTLPEGMSNLSNLNSLKADGNLFVNYIDEFNKLKGINISYLSLDGTLTEEEKAELLKLFPKAKVEEQANVETTETPVVKVSADLFQPIVPALDVPQITNTVDAEKGGTINYPSGTEVTIPQNAFVDKNNNPVSGTVMISYREFSSAADIAFSGIPMMYSKGDIAYPMESAGMFEINATKNGQAVFIKKGEKIDVSLASNDSSDTYNFYSMDPKSKEWMDEGKQGTIKIAKKKPTDSISNVNPNMPRELSPAWRNYTASIHQDDSILFNDRFYDSSFCYLHRTEFRTNRSYMRHVKISRYKKESSFSQKAVKGQAWFNIKNANYLSQSNPELRAFNGMTWICDGPENAKQFSTKYIRRKRYSDIRIERNGDSFTLLLKERTGITRIQAHPVNKYTGSAALSSKTYDRRYRNYTKALTRRETLFNKNLQQRRSQNYRDNMTIWNRLKPMMSDSEKVMTYDKWMQYYYSMVNTDSVTRFQKSIVAINSQMPYRRNVSITQFGYFNCDKPLLAIIALPMNAVDAVVRFGYKKLTEPKEYATIKVTYTDEQNTTMRPKQVMIIDKKIKSVAYIDRSTAMTIAVNTPKNLIAVMEDGKVGVFTENNFKNVELKNGNDYNFTLKMYNQNQLQELRRFLAY